MDRKIKYRKKTLYGAGLYALANLFDAPHVLECVDKFREGVESVAINEALKTISLVKNYVIEPIYFNHYAYVPPPLVLSIRPKAGHFWPILINVQINTHTAPHTVAAKVWDDGTVMIYDSLKEFAQVYNDLQEYVCTVERVYGIWHFCPTEPPYTQALMIKAE